MLLENDYKALITRALGAAEAERALAYELADPQPLQTSAAELLRMAPPNAHSAVLSAAWAMRLRDRYDMPAVAVAGDLKVAGQWVFRATHALPEMPKGAQTTKLDWRGHCWVEVGGSICDISIFRTMYSLPSSHEARQFVEQHFGTGRGAFVCRADDLPEGLKYRRQQVLTLNQMKGLFKGLLSLIEGH